MSTWYHLAEWGGLPVQEFLTYDDLDELGAAEGPDGFTGVDPEEAEFGPYADALDTPAEAVAWRLSTHVDAPIGLAGLFERFVHTVDTAKVQALVIGYWHTDVLSQAPDPVRELCAHADAFPALRHLFIGDIVGEESEVSWLYAYDVTPVLEAFPRLESLGYRFGLERDHTGLQLGLGAALDAPVVLRPLAHAALRRLEFQTGGMPAALPRAVAACEFPALEHLDLWLGVSAYGGDAEVADLAGLLDGTRFPHLRRLGLMNAEIQDAIATAVAGAPVVERLDGLDLSMGVLSDAGAEAMLAGQPLTHLRYLNLRHHFVSESVVQRLRDALEPAGVRVAADEARTPLAGARTPAEGRYTQVAE